jgi:hypothetical protein
MTRTQSKLIIQCICMKPSRQHRGLDSWVSLFSIFLWATDLLQFLSAAAVQVSPTGR